MAKAKSTAFFCRECGYESAKWLGQCPGCRAWNSMDEVKLAESAKGKESRIRQADGRWVPDDGFDHSVPRKICEVESNEEARFPTGMTEFDRVLGGGIVKGSLVLVGGDPGIGKSTILLQLCRNLVKNQKKVLYVSGEESAKQIKMRALRLNVDTEELYLLCETNLNLIEDSILQMNPDLVVIDSIQTMYREEVEATPGSVSQVRDCTSSLMRLAKGKGISIFIVGHVTKEGVVAGPRILEHMVDTVLYFEGEKSLVYRMLRSVKNRFGSTNEIGLFQMNENGLEQVENPSSFMLADRPKGVSGDVITCAMEGTRAVLFEIQALVSQSSYGGVPRRTCVGIDYNRVSLLMAVMEKRVGIHLSDCDAFVNVTSGIKISEPSLDLAIVVAIASSLLNISVPDDLILFGEVGLAGEIRAVSQTDLRVAEAEKLGFKRCILPRASLNGMKEGNQGYKPKNIRLVGVSNISEVLEMLRS